MPHKQKENHDHAARSKKERLRAKQELLARKKAQQEAREKAEAEAKLKPNIIPLADGAGEYEVGMEPAREIKVKVNLNKRSKKHLRIDLRREALEKERLERERQEEEERLKRQQEQMEKLGGEGKEEESSSSSEEEEPLIEEYLVYICECCRKKFNTTNQFVNHSNSKKHKDNAKLFEEAGFIVTDVQLRTADDNVCQNDEDNGEEGEEYDGYDRYDGYDQQDEKYNDEQQELEEYYESEEEEQPKVKNLFAALADDSSSSSESSEEEDDDNSEQDRKLPAVSTVRDVAEEEDNDDDDDDEIEMLEELIYQNQLLRNEMDAAEESKDDTVAAAKPEPIPFDDEGYNPDHLTVEERRLASVRHRLQKRLAAKGIEPTRLGSPYGASDAISVGRTLLQELMEANIDTLEAKLEAYNKHKAECQLLGKAFAFAKGNSKALAAQYCFKQDAADNPRRRANVHHAGSHYHMAASRSMQFGRAKGLMARHSSQGARLQASRMAAKEVARMQTGGGGMKIGKTSKKSQKKRQGEAGGSKKSGDGGTGDK